MKHLVNLIQLVVAVALVFPIFHLWDTDKVEQLCRVLEPAMEKAEFLELAEASNVKMIGPTDFTVVGGKWQATVVSRSPFAKESCLIKGVANKVAIVQMVNNDDS